MMAPTLEGPSNAILLLVRDVQQSAEVAGFIVTRYPDDSVTADALDLATYEGIKQRDVPEVINTETYDDFLTWWATLNH